MTDCFFCKKRVGWSDSHTTLALLMSGPDSQHNDIPPGMTEKDKICEDCILAGKIPRKWNPNSTSERPKGTMPAGFEPPTIENPPESQNISNISPKNSGPVTSAAQLRALTQTLHDQTKSQWDKNGVVQYKDNKIAILKRVVGQQVQFIVACSKVTEEGYRLMSVDEGVTAQGSGFTGGASAYFYFQKMDFVK